MLKSDYREETAKAVAEGLGAEFGEDFLGTREDRGELTLWVKAPVWARANAWMVANTGFKVLSDLTAVDYLDRNPRFDVSAILLDMETAESLRIKTLVAEDVEVDSLLPVWAGVNWFEREIYDLFGIRFKGNPNMRRLLLPPDYHGHPLRKDYPVTGPLTSVYR